MITIDLEESDDCVLADDNESDKFNKIKNNTNFKKSLILQVRKHRVLYDRKHKLFSNVAKKDLVWQQIANKLNSNVTECKDVWYELRYCYQRYARNLRNYFIHGHNKNLKRPAMGLESELMFLWRFIGSRKTCEIPFEIPGNKNTKEKLNFGLSKDNKSAATQKPIDDDLILVEEPVDLIVIDDNKDNSESDKKFKLNTTMKTLILLIKNYPELYDVKHSDFKDYTKKSYIWNSIANNLGDKATKLMKCWIVLQTRYEWEMWQMENKPNNKAVTSELQAHLNFFNDFIQNNSDTVFKQSYYLKRAWFDPIDYFKDIYNLIVRMKKMSEVIYITDSLLKTPEKSKEYISLWTEIANSKNTTPGQCETTWLIMRYFYCEIMQMRQQNYQLTDKWYFETIITELYAISKTAQTYKKQERERIKNKELLTHGVPSSKRLSPIPAPTPPAPVEAPLPVATTPQMTPTIINNLQNVPLTNSIHNTPATHMTLPKITSAISLAPQVLNTGFLQIKQISGPLNLSPAPLPLNFLNGNFTNATPSTTTASPTQMSMSFNLPSLTKVTQIPMPPPLHRPLAPANTPTIFRNITPPQIARPQFLLKPPPVNIQITACGPTANTNSLVNSQSTLSSVHNNGNACSTAAQSIASTEPSHNTSSVSSINSPLATTSTSSTTMAAMQNSVNGPTNSQLPKITDAISLHKPKEILIELIASQHGNYLLVHGPPLSSKYQLSMTMVAKFIREVLAIPLLHNKRSHQPCLINSYWEHISNELSLPTQICRACWSFLQENFINFPQIAPMNELMKPFQTSLNVWKESLYLLEKFDGEWASRGWLKYAKTFPEVVECIGGFPILYSDVGNAHLNKKVSEIETLSAWRTICTSFPKISAIPEIWGALKTYFVQYMDELEHGIENKWPMNWWRSLARLKFLVETKYSVNKPFYYIVSNKMLEEIDKCSRMEMKKIYKNDLPSTLNGKRTNEVEDKDKHTNDMMATIMASHSKRKKDVELGALINAVQKQPDICGKADNVAKYEAWREVGQELHMEVIASKVVTYDDDQIVQGKKVKMRRVWKKNWMDQRGQECFCVKLYKELEEGEPSLYTNFLRLDIHQFNNLLSLVSPIITKKDTKMRKSITAKDRLILTLRYLSNGGTLTSLQKLFRMHCSTICTIIPDVLDAIYTVLVDKYMKIPTTAEEWKVVAHKFNEHWQFPNCIGAVDGMHVEIILNGAISVSYNHTIVLMGVADAEYKFIYVDVSPNDGGTFNRCSFAKALDSNKFNLPEPTALPGRDVRVPYSFVAGDISAMRPNLLTPYVQSDLTMVQRVYNYRLNRVRRIIENTFGIMSARFRVLQCPIYLNSSKAKKVVLACCVLHNYMIDTNRELYTPLGFTDQYEENGQLIEGTWRQEYSTTSTSSPLEIEANVDVQLVGGAEEIQKEFTMYFVEEVPDCLFAFKHAAEKYFAYKKQDSVNRFRINQRYYKKFDEIVRSLPSGKFPATRGKINIKTPFELNQSVEADNSVNDASELVFPERYISEISMSNCPSNLAVKNWAFAIGNIPNFVESSNSKLQDILKKYLPDVK